MTTAINDQVIDVLARVADTEEVRTNPNLALYDLQILDSMKTVELIVALQQELNVDISPAEFDRDAWATPAKMVADVQQRLSA
jgi:D-alanine--poly(phosphoribitol) ligase subunit 2